MIVTQMTIDCETAKKWLETVKPEEQRKISKEHVNRLATALRRGEFVQNNDMFMHGPHGLGNGQHRCAAILVSRVPIQATVAFDCTKEEIAKADQEIRRRNASDALHYAGFSNSTNLAAIVNAIHRDLAPKSKILIPSEVVEFAEKYPEELQEASLLWNRATRGACPVLPSFVSALGFMGKQAGQGECVYDFCIRLADQMPVAPRDVIWLTLKRFREDKERVNQMSRRVKAAILIQAYNSYRKGHKRVLLRWSPNGGYAFPTID